MATRAVATRAKSAELMPFQRKPEGMLAFLSDSGGWNRRREPVDANGNFLARLRLMLPEANLTI